MAVHCANTSAIALSCIKKSNMSNDTSPFKSDKQALQMESKLSMSVAASSIFFST